MPSEAASDICEALGVSRATLHRATAPVVAGKPTLSPRRSYRSLSQTEREDVRIVMNSERFQDKPPAQIHATLLDEGVYLCSVSTMHRLLRKHEESGERRNQLVHPTYARPELLATQSNELWSWDITKLRGPAKWTCFYLYVILDVFSRLVVGWTLQMREDKGVASELIEQTCQKQCIVPGQLTIHADRGSSMTNKPVAFLLADLGVTKTHSRPHVSNDNPYSECQFKTMKYRPDFPNRFGSIEEARAFCQTFFAWYNTEHRHSGIAMLTPETVHYGREREVIDARATILAAAYEAHPERFVRQQPLPKALPSAVWINPPVLCSTTNNAGTK
jgi:putative transposase